MYILVLCLLQWICAITDARYGAPCDTYSNDCSSFDSTVCRNGKCVCPTQSYQLIYSLLAEPSCRVSFNELRMIVFGTGPCSPACNNDQICVDKMCKCKEGYVMNMDKQCLLVEYQRPLKSCKLHSPIAYICNPDWLSICSRGTCVCYKGYYPNVTSETCEKKEGYKGYYNGYCLEDNECIEGLKCSDRFKCICRVGCEYKEEMGACDCGPVTLASPSSVIITGCILGFCSIVFWCYVIRKSCKQAHKKDESSDDAHNENPLQTDAPTDMSYNIDQPISQNSAHIQEPENIKAVVDDPPSYNEAMASAPPPIGFQASAPVLGPTTQIHPEVPTAPVGPFYPVPPPSSQPESFQGPSFPSQYSSDSPQPLPYPATSAYGAAAPYPTTVTQGTSNTSQALPYPIAPSLPYPISPSIQQNETSDTRL